MLQLLADIEVAALAELAVMVAALADNEVPTEALTELNEADTSVI